MASQYFAILTDYGTRAIAHALSQGQPLQLTQFAVGDGNGKAVTPTANATALVHQTHIAPVSAVSLDPRNNKQVIVELTIPENIGGFYIREMGVFDAQNKLIAYANCPESFKPTESSGSGKVQVLRMILKVESSSAVTLSIDNSVIFVTRQQMAPKTITATTQNGFDDSGHSHEIAKASTTQQGVTQLYTGYDSQSEDLALTPKTAYQLKQLIDSNTRSLGNFIPNSKKSSAVNSNSTDTVATSAAVKTAYDKGVEAKTAADNAQRTANDGVSKADAAQRTANDGVSKANAAQTSANQAKSAADAAQHTANDGVSKANAANNNANGRVSKSGDTMTGNLGIKNSDWSGINLFNLANKYTRLEVSPDSSKELLTIVYRNASDQNQSVVTIPKKNGEVLLNTDITSSLSNNGWCKLPNGLILQWGKITLPDLTNEQTGVCTLPVTFPRAVFAIIMGSVAGSTSHEPGAQEGFSIKMQTTSNFTWVSSWESRNNRAFGNAPAQWIAIGY